MKTLAAANLADRQLWRMRAKPMSCVHRFSPTLLSFLRLGKSHRADVSIITPAIHYTMGGVRIDGEGRALHEQTGDGGAASPIPGLFAAGEVTGGVHGANRLAGNSLLECVVIGRLAGQHAGAEAAVRSAEECDDAGAESESEL